MFSNRLIYSKRKKQFNIELIIDYMVCYHTNYN